MQTIMIRIAVLNRRAVFAVILTPGLDKLCFESDNRIRLPRGVRISQMRAPRHGRGPEGDTSVACAALAVDGSPGWCGSKRVPSLGASGLAHEVLALDSTDSSQG